MRQSEFVFKWKTFFTRINGTKNVKSSVKLNWSCKKKRLDQLEITFFYCWLWSGTPKQSAIKAERLPLIRIRLLDLTLPPKLFLHFKNVTSSLGRSFKPEAWIGSVKTNPPPKKKNKKRKRLNLQYLFEKRITSTPKTFEFKLKLKYTAK